MSFDRTTARPLRAGGRLLARRRQMSGIRRAAVRWLPRILILVVSACSTVPHLNVIRDGDPVAIVSPVEGDRSKPFSIYNASIGQGARAGAASGAVAGAAYGLVCGPFFVFCSPMFAGAGAVVGAGTGAAVGTTLGLDADSGDQANAKIAEYLHNHNPQDALLAMVVNRVEHRWTLREPPVEKEVIVQLDTVRLHKKIDGPVVLVLRATVTVRYPNKAGNQLTRTRKFDYEGSETYIDSWADGREEFLALRFNDAYQSLAENIVVALSER